MRNFISCLIFSLFIFSIPKWGYGQCEWSPGFTPCPGMSSNTDQGREGMTYFGWDAPGSPLAVPSAQVGITNVLTGIDMALYVESNNPPTAAMEVVNSGGIAASFNGDISVNGDASVSGKIHGDQDIEVGLGCAATPGCGAIGVSSFVTGDASVVLGEDNHINNGHGSFLAGGHSEANNHYAIGIGKELLVNSSTGREFSVCVGSNLESNLYNMVIGEGCLNGPKLVNLIPHSLMIGMNSSVPSIFVEGAANCTDYGYVGIGGITAPQEALHVGGIIRANSLAPGGNVCADANGNLYISGPCTSGGPPDNLGDHNATMNLDMSCFDIDSITGLNFCNGSSLVSSGSNDLTFGHSTTNVNITIQGSGTVTGSWFVMSDMRVKKNIEPITDALHLIEQLDGVRYDFRRDEYPELHFPDRSTLGFIAQNVQELIPEAVAEDKTGLLKVNYDAIVPVLAEAIKEQSAIIQEQNEKITTLEERLAKIEEVLQMTVGSREEKVEDQMSLEIFPNPVTSLMNVSYQLPQKYSNNSIRLYNLKGQLAATASIDNKGKVIVPVDQLAAGSYVVSIYSGDQVVLSRTVIVQN